MAFTAKTVILDIADNWGNTSYLDIRAVDFYNNGSKILNPIPTAYATNYASDDYRPAKAFDTDLSKIGSMINVSWLSTIITNQRLIVVFDSSTTFDEIRINNAHNSGSVTDSGAKNVVIKCSTDTITDTTYNASISNSTEVFNGQFSQHVSSDVEDEQVLTLSEPSPTYTVTYDGNGNDSGTVPIDSGSYTEGSTVTVLGNTGSLAKIGMAFSGWNTASDGSGTSYVTDDTFLMGTANVTLYAVWEVETFTAKSVVFDIADNWGHPDFIGLRAVDFYNNGSKVLNSTPTAYETSSSSSSYPAENVFDTDLSKTGSAADTSWVSGYGNTTNQRLIVVFDANTTFDEIRVTNFHSSGSDTENGAKYVLIRCTTDTITDTTYNATIANSVQVFDGQFHEHVGSDVIDEHVVYPLATTYNVIYDGNASTSGTVPTDSLAYASGDTVTVLGNTGSLAKTGYVFFGWNTSPGGSGTNYYPDATFLMGSADVTLYAVWKPEEEVIDAKSVILDIADNWGDAGNMGIRSIDFYFLGAKIENAAPTAYATSFAGIDTSYAPENAFDTDLSKTGSGVDTAWLSDNGNITNQRLIVVFDSSTKFNEVRINNYHNQGVWDTNYGAKNVVINYSTDAVTDTVYGATILNGTAIFNGQFDEHVASDVEDEQTLTLTGSVTYSVTYDGNTNTSGTAPVDSTNYAESATVTVLGQSDLAKANHSFGGWNTSSDGTGTSYSEGGTFSMGTLNVTLYAQWIEDPTYNVIYNGNGNDSGSVPTDSTDYYENDTATVLGNTGSLAKTGYVFGNWNTALDGSGTDYAAGDTFSIGSTNITLYAVWETLDGVYKQPLIEISGTAENTSLVFGDFTVPKTVISGIAENMAMSWGDVTQPPNKIVAHMGSNGYIVQKAVSIEGVAVNVAMSYGRISVNTPSIKSTTGSAGVIKQSSATVSAGATTPILCNADIVQPKAELDGTLEIWTRMSGAIKTEAPTITATTSADDYVYGDLDAPVPQVAGAIYIWAIGDGDIEAPVPKITGKVALPEESTIIRYHRGCPVT